MHVTQLRAFLSFDHIQFCVNKFICLVKLSSVFVCEGCKSKTVERFLGGGGGIYLEYRKLCPD